MTPSRIQPSRGDVWLLDLGPVWGREQGRRRPCLIVSIDSFNHSPSELAVFVPLTSRERPLSSRVPVSPPEGGVRSRSFIKCEDVRSVSIERFIARWGSVSDQTLSAVEDRLRILLGL